MLFQLRSEENSCGQQKKYGKDDARTLQKNFHVDDLFSSLKDNTTAIKLLQDVISLFANRGFNHKEHCQSTPIISSGGKKK